MNNNNDGAVDEEHTATQISCDVLCSLGASYGGGGAAAAAAVAAAVDHSASMMMEEECLDMEEDCYPGGGGTMIKPRHAKSSTKGGSGACSSKQHQLPLFLSSKCNRMNRKIPFFGRITLQLRHGMEFAFVFDTYALTHYFPVFVIFLVSCCELIYPLLLYQKKPTT
jgi:hypothetical protein